MRVKTTLNAASLPAAVDEAVKRGYNRDHAEWILTRYVENRFPLLEETPNEAFVSHSDPGDEHPHCNACEDDMYPCAACEAPEPEPWCTCNPMPKTPQAKYHGIDCPARKNGWKWYESRI